MTLWTVCLTHFRILSVNTFKYFSREPLSRMWVGVNGQMKWEHVSVSSPSSLPCYFVLPRIKPLTNTTALLS